MQYLFALAALLFALPAQAVVMEWVTVGDPGNAANTNLDTPRCGPTGYQPCGAVADVYRIGKYEVTNAQYAEFLNAVATTDTYELYNTEMGNPLPVYLHGYGGITRSGSPGSYTYSAIAGRENMPVNWVSFWDALRFANWLHNGQPTGPQNDSTTEDGAYTLNGYTGTDGRWITRNADANIFLPSEAEWYKAAYYDASTLSYNPYPFADGFDGVACETPPGTTSHSANCNYAVADLTDVGEYTGSPSEYGTFDQGGNLFEWNETSVLGFIGRVLRGWSFGSPGVDYAASGWIAENPTYTYNHFGFRVASLAADCEDELDNDGDGFIDFPDDPGCFNSMSDIEDPKCQDGADNDGDGKIDFDGGLSALGYVKAELDPRCTYAWQVREGNQGCGLGSELALLLPPLMLLSRGRNRTA